jgi:hypothetical protein
MRGKDKLKELGITDEEFERQFQEATRRGEEAIKTEPRAAAVRYDKKQKRIVVDLVNGVTLIFPPYLLQEVCQAREEDIADVKILGEGFTLEWTKLDQHFSVKGLLNGLFGNESWMDNLSRHLAAIGAKGGSAKTEAKRKASAENGKRGGRPRKHQAI